jgi:hypothetical protein
LTFKKKKKKKIYIYIYIYILSHLSLPIVTTLKGHLSPF